MLWTIVLNIVLCRLTRAQNLTVLVDWHADSFWYLLWSFCFCLQPFPFIMSFTRASSITSSVGVFCIRCKIWWATSSFYDTPPEPECLCDLLPSCKLAAICFQGLKPWLSSSSSSSFPSSSSLELLAPKQNRMVQYRNHIVLAFVGNFRMCWDFKPWFELQCTFLLMLTFSIVCLTFAYVLLF